MSRGRALLGATARSEVVGVQRVGHRSARHLLDHSVQRFRPHCPRSTRARRTRARRTRARKAREIVGRKRRRPSLRPSLRPSRL